MSFPRYERYKDSGVEWLGEVPEHWILDRLKWSVEGCINGLWGDDPNGEDVIPCIRVADFDRAKNRVRAEDLTYRSISEEKRLNRSLKNGDLLIEKSGGGDNQPVGVVVLFDHNLNAVCSNFVARMPVRSNFSPRFLCYLHSVLYALRLNTKSIKQNTGIQNLDSASYLDERFGIPTVYEQGLIADFLDRETAKIDALIAEQQRLVELLKEKRQAVISHAVTKGLNPDAPMKDSGIEWLGEVPEHWVIVPLKHLTAPGRDIMYGIVLPGPNVDNGVPIVKGGDVRPHRLRLELLNRTTEAIEAPYARARLRPSDIVYSIRGSIGDAELVPDELLDANITQDVARISPDQTVNSLWLLFVMKSVRVFVQLEQRSLGAAVRGINIFDLKRARIPFPDIQEQKTIATFLDRETTKLDALTAEAQTAITLLQERRTALISAAVTGKIDVRGFASDSTH
ncbi:restriction endonuclease subunit S [Allochromatium vinosum]|uniref:Restriction modification system DNA specificity domain protein n=1 Tax=Allochromatium vinosum (strain ATCC 17899 / DSM 180 / NBRC 103801 / NCIMB 10441 / D) TaxID=572477 RepID=D3RWE1_ALLVD|nr:restriction endonuclease subunit S [Allochromatium vinosum]ADC64153.1 restriction modification system DNA specificity domain protein [Allochromatium vinosum DSM 180]